MRASTAVFVAARDRPLVRIARSVRDADAEKFGVFWVAYFRIASSYAKMLAV